MTAIAANDGDQDLLERYGHAADAAALDALVARHWADAFRLALRALGDPAAAEDAAQEAFIGLARAARRARPDAAFAPWFRTIVLNSIRNHARAARRRRRHEALRAGAAPRESAGDAGERRVLAAEVEERLRALPLDLRFPLLLHYYEGRPHEEVAAAIGCPKGTAASRIRRGLERLRESFGAAAIVPADALDAVLERELRAARTADAALAVPGAPSAATLDAAARAGVALAGKLAAAAAAALLLAGATLAVLHAGGEARPRASAPAIAREAASRTVLRTEPAGDPIVATAPEPRAAPVSMPAVPHPAPISAVPSAPAVRAPAPVAPLVAPASEDAARIFGRVTDESGAPLAGVAVSLGPKAALEAPPAPGRSVETGVNGAYEIAGIPPGRYSLRVDPPRHASPPAEALEVAARAAIERSFRLGRGERATGRVVDRSGRGIGGIEVSIMAATPAPQSRPGARLLVGEDRGATTAEDGTFEASGFSSANFQDARAVDPAGRYAAWRGPFRAGMAIVLDAAAIVTGRVLERGSGAPIAGADVAMLAPGLFGGARASTDDAGEFSLPCSVLGPATVRARAPGHAPGAADVDLQAGLTASVTIEMGAGGTLLVTVVGPDGAPIAGATVTEIDAAAPALPGRFFAGPVPLMQGPGGAPAVAATTDAAGHATIPSLPPGRVRLRAEAEGRIPGEAAVDVAGDGAQAEARIVLREGGAIAGLVRLSGGRAPDGARVHVLLPGRGFVAPASVGADGAWHVGGLEAGRYQVGLLDPDAEGLGPALRRAVDVVEGETARCDLDESAAEGAVVAGVVRMAGAPVAGATVTLEGADGPAGTPQTTGAGGGFRVAGVAPGRYRARVDGRPRRDLDVPPGVAEVAADVDLPSLSITGRVVDASGAPVAGASIDCRLVGASGEGGGFLPSEIQSAADGTFAIGALEEGAYTIAAALEGRGSARLGPVQAGGDPVVLTLVGGATLSARVLGPDGRPAAIALLVVRDASGRAVGGGGRPFVLGPGADLEAHDLAPGAYEVLGILSGGAFARIAGVHVDGDAAIDVPVGPGGVLALRAIDGRTGGPLAGAQATVAFADGAPLPPVFTASAGQVGVSGATSLATTADGTARRPGLAPGRYMVRVTTGDGRAASAAFSAEDDATADVVVTVP
jgi:RNA polymerase sigma factor (sigma-70 family)